MKENIKRYSTLILGLFLYALAYNLFLKTNNIVAGDVDGIANIFKGYINPNILIAILCVFLLIISFPLLGVKTTMGSVIGTIVFPLFITLTSDIANYIPIDNYCIKLYNKNVEQSTSKRYISRKLHNLLHRNGRS